MRLTDRLATSALGFASCLALAVACNGASNSTVAPDITADAGASSSDAGDAGELTTAPLALAFTETGTLTLDPKEAHVLVVQTEPPGSFHVRFALLGDATLDAALDASEVVTDALGVARVTLTAPSAPTTFNVRASVTSAAQTRIAIAVSARNYTTLRVLPSYAGRRPIQAWTATVSAGVACASLSGTPPPDGDLSTTQAVGQPLDIEKVPLGVALAVTLRAGHYAGGCADQPALTERDGNQILVWVVDRPIDLTQTKLDLSFGPAESTAALSKLMNATVLSVTNALNDSGTGDVTALLNAMQAAAPDPSAFSEARASNAWDELLTNAFGDNAANRLRAPANRWLSAGLANFYGAQTFLGTLAPHGSDARFTPSSVAGVSAADAGLAGNIAATWSADPSDTLLLGMTLTWPPSQLASALALAPAILEFPKATTVEDALASSVDCSLVGTTLAPKNIGTDTDCELSCLTSTCEQSIASLWQAASQISGDLSASLNLTGTGKVVVDDDAAIAQLKGTWVGLLTTDEQTSAPTSGALSATASSN